MFIAIFIEILGIPILPVAIGLYLPLELSVPIMAGGILRYFIDRKKKSDNNNQESSSGVLFCSGLIAGEGLIGIILAIFAVVGADKAIDLSDKINTGTIGGVVLFIVMMLCIAKSASAKNKTTTNEKEE